MPPVGPLAVLAGVGARVVVADIDPDTAGELAEAWRPYFEFCIEAFGAGRCMFESDFPPDKDVCSYTAIWNAFKRVAAGASRDEKAALFHDTAARVYKLKLPHQGGTR